MSESLDQCDHVWPEPSSQFLSIQFVCGESQTYATQYVSDSSSSQSAVFNLSPNQNRTNLAEYKAANFQLSYLSTKWTSSHNHGVEIVSNLGDILGHLRKVKCSAPVFLFLPDPLKYYLGIFIFRQSKGSCVRALFLQNSDPKVLVINKILLKFLSCSS